VKKWVENGSNDHLCFKEKAQLYHYKINGNLFQEIKTEPMPTKKKAAKKAVKKKRTQSVKKAATKPARPKGRKKVHAKKKVVVKGKRMPPASSSTLESAPPVVTATISATFTNVNPGLSELNAILNGVTKTLKQSGTLKFDNVLSGDVIMIQGKSLGTSDISMDIPASPPKMKFPPGTFNFNFFIL
jgi:hypothetical protein